MVLLVASLLTSPASAADFGPWLESGPEERVELTEDTGVEIGTDETPPACEAWLPSGMQLPEAPDLYTIWDPQRAYGTPFLIETLEYTASSMHWEFPDSDAITVGDISTRRGGPLAGHRTHNAGLDADIGFYYTGGRQSGRSGFVDATPKTMDLERTWAEVDTLLSTGRIQFILLDRSLIDALEVYVRDNELLSHEDIAKVFPDPNTPDLWERSGYLRHATGHKNHLHVRVKCTGRDAVSGG